jgi:type IX secretion system substrate protein
MLLACRICEAQNVTGFLITFGSNVHGTSSVVQTDDGGLIVSGNFGWAFNEDIFITKVSADGNILWTKRIGNANSYESCYASCRTASGNILLGGEMLALGGSGGIYFAEIDTAGNLLRTKTYPLSQNGSEISSMIKTSDNGYVVTGHSYSFPYEYIMIARFDSSLNMLWQKIGSLHYADAEGNSITQTSDGGFAVTGYLTGSNGFLSEFFIKLDSSGNSQWFKIIGFANQIHERGVSIIQNTNGNYTIAGMAQIGTVGPYYIYLTKFDSFGTLLWSKIFTTGGSANSLINTSDGGYIVGGNQFLLKYDVNDSLQWSTSDTTGYGNTTCVIETGNHAIVAAGVYSSNYAFISKMDSLGLSCGMVPFNFSYTDSMSAVSMDSIPAFPTPAIDSGGVINVMTMSSSVHCISVSSLEIVNPIDKISIFPNPFSDKLNILNNNTKLSEIILYDITSRKLLEQKYTKSALINTTQLTKGIYLYEVRNKNGVIKKGKVVKD